MDSILNGALQLASSFAWTLGTARLLYSGGGGEVQKGVVYQNFPHPPIITYEKIQIIILFDNFSYSA